jgi:hypothetical protein
MMQAQTLNQFFTAMALNPDKLASYTVDPEGAMEAANLPAEDRDVLRKANRHEVFARLKGIPLDGREPLASQAPFVDVPPYYVLPGTSDPVRS